MLKQIQARNAQREAAKGRLRMNLQHFAEPDPADDPNGEPGDVEPKGDDPKGKDNPDDPENPKSFTQEELDNIVQREKAKAKTQADKEFHSKVEAAVQAKIDEVEKLKNMNEDERTKHEKEQLENELAELRRDKALIEMGKEAKLMLADKNIQATDEVLAFVVDEDAEVTSDKVTKFAAIIEAQRVVIREEFNKKLGGRVPVGGTADPNTLSEAAKLAQNRNEQSKAKPNAYDPWAKQ